MDSDLNILGEIMDTIGSGRYNGVFNSGDSDHSRVIGAVWGKMTNETYVYDKHSNSPLACHIRDIITNIGDSLPDLDMILDDLESDIKERFHHSGNWDMDIITQAISNDVPAEYLSHNGEDYEDTLRDILVEMLTDREAHR